MDPTPIPIPLPVDFGPHVGDWVLIVVTAAGVLASIAVALVAALNARDARRIALDARDDEARRERETEARLAAARDESITRAYAKHLKLLAAYARNLREWVQRQPRVRFVARSLSDVATAVIDAPPSINEVRGDLEVLRMFVPEDHRATLIAMGKYLARLDRLPPREQEPHLWRLVSGIRKWRTTGWTTAGFNAMLRDKTARMDARIAELEGADAEPVDDDGLED
jgi:hypothetical protein